ncbi:hypothetical protein [Halorhabdus amylolytica]|uniref:hypothetical protein n=1 Tax=Halorhabdus amylolytica TaxID=2559573 RepID=UPI0010AB023C|nr:hypothetical protein [Halorhabdus amylolytica]
MTAKYSADSNGDASEWYDDREIVLARWSDTPFVGHRHRHETVEQRLVVEYIHEIGVDIRHEVRSDDTEKFSDNWSAVETIEVREYGARHDRRPEARWLE